MKGLPPVPDPIALMELGYDVDGSHASTWHWLFVDGLQALGYSAMRTLWADLVNAVLTPVTDLMASAGTVSTCRLKRWGGSPLEVLDEVGPNHGANGGCQSLSVASQVRWITAGAVRMGVPFTRWPAFPDNFTDDHRTLNSVGWAQVGARSTDFLNAVNAVTTVLGGSVALVGLHRSAGLHPLPTALYDLIIACRPTPVLGSVTRRRGAFRP